jgi:hypothetical protein
MHQPPCQALMLRQHERDAAAMAQRYSIETPTATRTSGPHKSPSRPLKRIRASDPSPISETDADERRFCSIPYADSYFYFDTVKYLSKSEIAGADMAWLHRACKRVDIRAHGQWVRPKNGEPYQINIYPYRFRIEVHVPYPKRGLTDLRDLTDLSVLEFFAKLPDTKVTAAHIARDFTFDDEAGISAMLELFEMHWVQRWQRKHERISFDNGGLSTGRRSKGYYETVYISRPCRIDGVVACFHGEGRHLGTAALAQIGINSASDLLDFDFTKYHSQKDQSSLKAIDKHRLGRYARNRTQKTRDREADAADLRIGGLIWRIYSLDDFGNRSVEQFIRSYRPARSAKNIIGTVDTGRA